MAGLFERYRDNSEANNLVLRELFNTRARTEKLIMEAARVCGAQNLSHWINGDKRYEKLPDNQYQALAFYAAARGWFPVEQQFVYGQLCETFGQNVLSLPRSEMEIHYAIYRLSFLAPGYILQGSLTLRRCKGSVAILTKEMTGAQAGVGGGDGVPEWPRSGMLLPRGGNQYLLMSTKDQYRDQIQTAYLADVGGMNRLEGPFTDWHGSAFYSGHLIAIQRKKPLPDNEILALIPDQVEERIVTALREASDKGNILTLEQYGGRSDGKSKGQNKRRRTGGRGGSRR